MKETDPMGDRPIGDRDLEVATLGGGCFWCLEPAFEELEGVEDVGVGYAGGDRPDPTYREVCTGRTGHAEVVQVRFDPSVVPYRRILEVFFTVHDPTQRDRQGADVGPQYRSIILYDSEEQRETARAVIDALGREGPWDDPIVTELVPLEAFYRAEEEHQAYYRKHPERSYCQAVIRPKLEKFRRAFADARRPAAG